MTFIAISNDPHARYPHLTKTNILLRCDECDALYKRKHLVKAALSQRNHFCGGICHDQALNRGVLRQRRDELFREAYGVSNPYQLPHVRARAHESAVVNSSTRNSNQENRFYAVLIDVFGESDVKRQVLVDNKWFIDFHIVSLDAYVQFDGAYWHGLNRPIEVISKSDVRRDKTILETFIKDRRQDEWFPANEKKLVRVTDVEFKQHGSDVVRLVCERVASLRNTA